LCRRHYTTGAPELALIYEGIAFEQNCRQVGLASTPDSFFTIAPRPPSLLESRRCYLWLRAMRSVPLSRRSGGRGGGGCRRRRRRRAGRRRLGADGRGPLGAFASRLSAALRQWRRRRHLLRRPRWPRRDAPPMEGGRSSDGTWSGARGKSAGNLRAETGGGCRCAGWGAAATADGGRAVAGAARAHAA